MTIPSVMDLAIESLGSVTIGGSEPAIAEVRQIDLERVKLDPAWTRVLPASVARRHRILALCEVHGEVVVATSQRDTCAIEQLLVKHISQPYRLVQVDDVALRRLLRAVLAPSVEPARASAGNEGAEVIEACDDLFSAALLRGASDIHLVPGDSAVQANLRVDGVIEAYRTISSSLYGPVVSRIKVLAGLDISEKRQPQDGRFTLERAANYTRTDIRAATIPTRYGERVTLRLLPQNETVPQLSDLGMTGNNLDRFHEVLQCANGLVLLTGPTGCGKSTTLYAAMHQLLNARGGNVITIEDPIEYEIPGTTQVEVDAAEKVSFSRALRSILRHDPDVIMLGEIRDAETAELAIKASLTGHLVFSTLHTNTAAGVVTRLLDIGIDPFLVAATLRLAVAQRLVRNLCPDCKKPIEISQEQALSLGDIELAGQLAYEPQGCVYCAGRGYVGRTALFETLRGGCQVQEMLAKGATEKDFIEYMRKADMSVLIDDGVRKILSGTTTVQQVLGVVGAW